MNIQRSAAGIFTCEATHKVHGTTRNSTVNVIVQSEYHYSMYIQNVICEKGELGTRYVYINVHIRVANTFIICALFEAPLCLA